MNKNRMRLLTEEELLASISDEQLLKEAVNQYGANNVLIGITDDQLNDLYDQIYTDYIDLMYSTDTDNVTKEESE